MPDPLPTRRLGSQGLQVPLQGLGCLGMSAFYSGYESEEAQQESLDVIDKAICLGCNFFDTADIYGPYTNEELLGKAMKGRRDKFIVSTKFGFKLVDGKRQLDSSRAYVRAACEASLKRLGTHYIDLYFQHRVDPATPIEETMLELKALKEEGKVHYIGLSEATADEIRRAHAVFPVSAYQLEWSLWTRDAEKDIIPVCRELGIGLVAYSPLGRGFLTGKIASANDLSDEDWRKNNPRFFAENIAKNMALVEKVKEIALSKGCTSGQLALAWVTAQGEDVVPIPGTKRLKYLEENIASTRITLTDDDMCALDFRAMEIHGHRYDDVGMALVHNAHEQQA